jgi:hypothetical protein
MSDDITTALSLLASQVNDAVGSVMQFRWKGDPGQRIAGRLVSTSRVPHSAGGESVLCLVLDTDDGRFSCLAYGYPEKTINEVRGGSGPVPGDVIAIERGGLVARDEGSSFREWSVVVLPHDEHAGDDQGVEA